MIFRRYHQSDIFIESETENVKFKRYIENENKRFLQYVEGTITELLPKDFEVGITTLPSYAIYGINGLLRVELPDRITTFQIDSINSLDNVQEIIFPQNVTTINPILNNGDNTNIIADFSKARKVPTLIITDASGTKFNCFAKAKTIKVPSALYNSWITANNWTTVKDKIVAVT